MVFDCIIVGSGPAGLSAAINLKTYNKSFLWFGQKSFSQKVGKAEKIINYPGFPEITGEELKNRFLAHMESAGIEISDAQVTNIMAAGKSFMVLAGNEIYNARTVILTPGVMNARLLENEDRLLGAGLSYCATCDGMFYKGKKIAVLSSTKAFEHEVEYLADLADEVIFFPLYKDNEVNRENVTLSKDFPVAVNGGFRVESLTLKSGKKLEVDGLFCLRNAVAPSKLLPGLLTDGGHIPVNRAMETNLPGCFAAGDCTGRPYQYTKAVGEGNVAAHSCIEYLAKLDEKT